MSITRRSILRNIGALTAVQTLPAAAGSLLIGCKSQPAPAAAVLAPQMMRVIFEGPWIFSHAPGDRTTLIARAEVIDPHISVCGKWVNGVLSQTGIAQPGPSGRWNGTFSPAQATSNFDVLKDAYTAAKAVIMKSFSLDDKTYPTDFSISLPMPNKVFLGGGLVEASIKDPNGLVPAGAIPMTDTILHYDQNSGTTPFVLTIGDASNQFPVNASDDLIFRIMHNNKKDCTPDSVHIPRTFGHQCLRLIDGNKKNPNLSLTLPHATFTPNQLPDGLTDLELGLGMDSVPCSPAPVLKGKVAPAQAPADLHVASGDWSSCSGGGIASDS